MRAVTAVYVRPPWTHVFAPMLPIRAHNAGVARRQQLLLAERAADDAFGCLWKLREGLYTRLVTWGRACSDMLLTRCLGPGGVHLSVTAL